MSGISVGLGIAGVAASVVGGAVAAHGAGQAADATLQASREANVENKRQFDISQKNQAPFLGGGAAALGRLDYLLGLNPVIGDSTRSFNQNFGPMGPAPNSTLTPAQRLQTLSGGTTGSTNGSTVRDGRVVPGEGPLPGPRFDARDIPSGADLRTLIASRRGTISTGTTTPPPDPNAPYDPNGYGSLMHDFSAQDFQADPGYAFRLSEGQKALERSAAARGVLGSGSFLKDLTDYNQQSGSQEYGNAYNRFQNNRTTRYNFLSNAAGGGQVAANQLGQLGADYARTYGANLMSGATTAANLRASGYAALGGSIASSVPTFLAGYNYNKPRYYIPGPPG